MVIDAHSHTTFFQNVEKMIENLDRYKIDRAWILSSRFPKHEYAYEYVKKSFFVTDRDPIEETAEWVSHYPKRLIPGFIPDPRDPGAYEELKKAHTLGFKLCGELKHRMMYDSPDALRIFKLAGTLKMPITVHLDIILPPGGILEEENQYWFGGTLAAFLTAVKKCPKTIFIGHAPGFWRYISGDAESDPNQYPKTPATPGGVLFEIMDKYPNLYCDISANSGLTALSRSPETGIAFLERFQDKVLYGRDHFGNQHQEYLETIDISKAVREKLMWENAEKLLR